MNDVLSKINIKLKYVRRKCYKTFAFFIKINLLSTLDKEQNVSFPNKSSIQGFLALLQFFIFFVNSF